MNKSEWKNLKIGDFIYSKKTKKPKEILSKWGRSPCYSIESNNAKDGTTVACFAERINYTLKS